MKRQASYRMRMMWLGVVVGILAGGGVHAKAEIIMSEATCVDQVINNGTNTQECSFLHDGLKLYFTNAVPGEHNGHEIWVASREAPNAPWKEPVNLGPNVNSGSPCIPAISPDELELYFHGSLSSTDLMRSTRTSKDEPWGPPELFTGLGSPACDLDISADGLTVYFDSDRLGGNGGWDIWMARRETVNAPWGEPVNLGSKVNDARNQSSPSISNDGLSLFYNNGGLQRISVTLRATTDDPWGPPVLLGPAVNGQSWNHGAEISPDGSVLYFDSGRPGGLNKENFWQVQFIPIVDFTGNGTVDIDDLTQLIAHWGQEELRCDIAPMPWGDGKVDAADLEVLMSYWGQEISNLFLVGHWKLDEAEGIVAADKAGTNNGALVGNPIWQPAGGKLAGALQLGGLDDYVRTAFVVDPGKQAFSVFAWVKGGGPGQVILSQVGGANWLMAGASDGELMTDLKSGRQGKSLTSATVITDDAWHRVGLVWDGSNRILYVDDIEVAKDTQANLPSSSGGLYIGAGSTLAPGTFWSGLIDDVRIYNRAVKP